MPNIGPLEIAVVLIILLLVFGPKRLPGLGKQIGSGMREFKDSISGKDSDKKKASDDHDKVDGSSSPESPTPALEAAVPEAVMTTSDSTKEAEEQISGRRDQQQ